MHRYKFIFNSTLIGIALISVFAFFGFGSIFRSFNASVGAQAVSAAFGALFVILSTKFLMEHEGENRLKGEKRSVVFRENLQDYKIAADKIIKVLSDKRLDLVEIQDLRTNHALLILLGSKKSIDAFRLFLQACQNIIENAEDTAEDGSVKLTSAQELDLWNHALVFLGAAREGLNLAGDDFDIENEKEAFRGIAEVQTIIETKYSVREDIGTLSNWALENSISDDRAKYADDFIKLLLKQNPNLTVKYTKTQISFGDKTHPKNARILFLNGIAKSKNEIKISLNATFDKIFCVEQMHNLKEFSPTLRESRGATRFDLALSIPFAKINDSDLRPLSKLIEEYKIKFHK